MAGDGGESLGLTYDPEAVQRNLESDTFRVFRLHGFTDTELENLAWLSTQTRGRSCADLYELLPMIATMDEPELAGEFMRTPNDDLAGLTPLDLIGDKENFPVLRRAIAQAVANGW